MTVTGTRSLPTAVRQVAGRRARCGGATQRGGDAVPAFARLQRSPARCRTRRATFASSPRRRATRCSFGRPTRTTRSIQQILGGVDLRPLQVLIEVTIAEVARTHDLDVGVSGSSVPDGGTDGRRHRDASARRARATSCSQLTGGNGTINYDVAIAALQERGDVRVLSLPVIIAQNNRQAVLNVGSSRPFVQVSQSVPIDPTGRVQTVQYIDVGTVLTITPTINPDGYVNLQVTQTDNSATNEVQFDAPIINKREATTQIFIRDGQTTVIGGLADNTQRSTDVGHSVPQPHSAHRPVSLRPRTTERQHDRAVPLPHAAHHLERRRHRRAARCREGRKRSAQDVPVGPRIVPKADTLNADPARRPMPSRRPIRRAAAGLARDASPTAARTHRCDSPSRRRSAR